MPDQAPNLPAPAAPVLPAPALATPALATLTLAALLLAGCSGNDMSRHFGFTRDAPDERTATTQVPLSMPPDFTVRPPQPGAPRPQQISEQQQAEQALVPQTALTGTPTGEASAGQDALVQVAGPTPPANIRYQVNNAAATEVQQSQGFVDKLMFWRDRSPRDRRRPAEGGAAICENAALGRSQDTGNNDHTAAKEGLAAGVVPTGHAWCCISSRSARLRSSSAIARAISPATAPPQPGARLCCPPSPIRKSA